MGTNKRRIRILRSGKPITDSTISEIILEDGQPFYNKNTKYLYIGNGSTKLSQLNSIVAENANVEAITETGDTDATINFKIGSGKYKKTVNNVENSNSASDVTTTIASKSITDIFESDGITVKNSTNTSKVKNVDFEDTSKALFGNNIVTKYITLYSDSDIMGTDLEKGVTYSLGGTLSFGDILELHIAANETIGTSGAYCYNVQYAKVPISNDISRAIFIRWYDGTDVKIVISFPDNNTLKIEDITGITTTWDHPIRLLAVYKVIR